MITTNINIIIQGIYDKTDMLHFVVVESLKKQNKDVMYPCLFGIRP